MSSKKAKTSKETTTTYEQRDVVLAKIRGYPSWPAIIVDPDAVPANVRKERPGKGGKSAFYCVRFFPAGDFAWVLNKDISKLKTHEIEAYISEPSKKNGDLLDGYKIALDPTEWLSERERAAAAAEEAEANAEVDQLEGEDEAADGDGDDDEKPKGKKRKRDAAEGGADKKKAKSKKEKVDKASNGEGKKKGGSAPPKGKKSGKSKALVESEDEGEAEDRDTPAGPGPSKKDSAPPAKKAKKEKEEKKEKEDDSALSKDPEAERIKNWRHSFQRTLLGKAPPKEEDLPTLNELFTTVEQYDNFTIEYLTYSKIGKVMRHIAALPEEKAPKDVQYKFRERARALVDKWQGILGSSKAANGDASPSAGAKEKEHEHEHEQGRNGKGGEGKKGKKGGASKAVNGEREKEIEAAVADMAEKPDQTSAEVDASMADMTMAEDD